MRAKRAVAVRLPNGKLHVAVRHGRGYLAACHRMVRGTDLVVHEGRQADRAWRLEQICTDCENLRRRGPRELIRVAGW